MFLVSIDGCLHVPKFKFVFLFQALLTQSVFINFSTWTPGLCGTGLSLSCRYLSVTLSFSVTPLIACGFQLIGLHFYFPFLFSSFLFNCNQYPDSCCRRKASPGFSGHVSIGSTKRTRLCLFFPGAAALAVSGDRAGEAQLPLDGIGSVWWQSPCPDNQEAHILTN